LGLVYPFVESGLEVVKSTIDGVKFTPNLVIEGVNFGIDGSNFISHFMDGLLVLFGFILQGKDFLVVSGDHLGIKGAWKGEWVHGKKRLRSDIYHIY
jgi:hypothetical protein